MVGMCFAFLSLLVIFIIFSMLDFGHTRASADVHSHIANVSADVYVLKVICVIFSNVIALIGVLVMFAFFVLKGCFSSLYIERFCCIIFFYLFHT